jgi:hypothetical protein
VSLIAEIPSTRLLLPLTWLLLLLLVLWLAAAAAGTQRVST